MLGTGVTAYAADVDRGAASKFTYGPETDAYATTDIDSFYLIKDYDSVNSAANAPKSISPADTFIYTIEPYSVWNAGNTDSEEGAATPITKDNMPMLYARDNEENKYTATPNGSNETRKLVINQSVDTGAAKDSESAAETKETEDATDHKALISLPIYSTVGDYWYKVEETLGNTTGVLYGTNSNKVSDSTDESTNGGFTGVYYIHVQVTESGTAAGDPTLLRSVTMHKSAPATSLSNADYNGSGNIDNFYKAGNKVNAIENQYYAGDLVIKKKVTGNAGDKNKFFKVTVTFTKPQGTVINSDIVCNNAYLLGEDGKYTNTSSIKISGQYSESTTPTDRNRYWTGGSVDTDAKTVSCDFYVKDDTTVTFSNIPYGINYTVEETVPSGDTYKNEIKFTSNSKDEAEKVLFNGKALTADTDSASMDDSANTKTATGSISDAHDEVTIENNKVKSVDIGVFLSNAPFIALLGVAGAGAAVLVRRKRRIGE